MLENAAESHKSTARFVGQPAYQNAGEKKDNTVNLIEFYTQLWFLPEPKKLWLIKRLLKKDFAKQTTTKILGKPTQPKNDNANETNKILQTQLTRTFAENR